MWTRGILYLTGIIGEEKLEISFAGVAPKFKQPTPPAFLLQGILTAHHTHTIQVWLRRGAFSNPARGVTNYLQSSSQKHVPSSSLISAARKHPICSICIWFCFKIWCCYHRNARFLRIIKSSSSYELSIKLSIKILTVAVIFLLSLLVVSLCTGL